MNAVKAGQCHHFAHLWWPSDGSSEDLQEVEDAERIHESVIDCFESACLPHLTQEDKEQMLHFVIVGGGPTGVEFAAELHDLIYEDLLNLYPHLKPYVNITLVQSADHILNS